MRLGVLALVLLWGCEATAETPIAVADVLDGAVLVLEGGKLARLGGLLVPGGDEPGAEAALFGVKELAVGRLATVVAETGSPDRHGRTVAQVTRSDGLWLQGEMLRRGLARVWTPPDEGSRAAEMLAVEAEARAAGRGLWNERAWRIRGTTPGPLLKEGGTFQIIEGRVLKAARVKGTVYLNFDDTWRTDFTAILDKAAQKRFREAKVDPLKTQGRLVRVRGWLVRRDGPAIEVSSPDQIEIVE